MKIERGENGEYVFHMNGYTPRIPCEVVHALIRKGMEAQRQTDADLLNESARITAAQIIVSDKPELAKKLANLLLEASGSVLDQPITDADIAKALEAIPPD